jgi:hypothetical protein
MRKLPYTIAVTLALIAAGFVTVSFVQSKTDVIAKWGNIMPTPDIPTALPTALVGFPDIEHVPVYPNASVTFTRTEATKLNHFSYQVGERMDKVAAFYQEMLPKKGWLLKRSNGLRSIYSWTDPEGKLFWQMYLEVGIEMTLDQSKTAVYLDYGRYPNTEKGLPLYPDAQQVSVTHSNIEKNSNSEKTHVTDITYLSNASPQEIAAFYTNTNSMQEYGWYNREPGWSTEEYGWFPFDDPGSWAGYNPREGLYFSASRPTWGEKSGVYSYQLLATATLQEDGRIRIKLHVEEMESSLGNS